MSESKKVTPKKVVAKKKAAPVSSIKNVTKKRSAAKKVTSKSVTKKPVSKKNVKTKPVSKPKVKSGVSDEPVLSPFFTSRHANSMNNQTGKLNIVSRFLMTPKALITLVQFDADEVAIQVARYGGVASIVIGALFTVYFTAGIFDSRLNDRQTAALTNSVENIVSQDTAVQPALTKDMVTFDVAAPSPLREKVPLIVQVPASAGVKSIILTAQNAETKQSFQIGFAQKKTETTYEAIFDSVSVPNGKYRFVATVRALDIELVIPSGDPYDVLNHSVIRKEPIIEPVLVPVASSTTTDAISNENNLSSSESEVTENEVPTNTIEAVTPEQTIEADFSVRTIETNDLLRLITYTGEAQLVEFFARKSGSTAVLYIGRAYSVESNIWQYAWNLQNVPAGSYSLYARVRTLGGTKVSKTREVTVTAPVFAANVPLVEKLEPVEQEIDDKTVNDQVQALEQPVIESYSADPVNSSQELTDADYERSRLAKQLIVPEVPELLANFDFDSSAYERSLQDELQRLAVAIRSSDRESESLILGRIVELETKAVTDAVSQSGKNNDDILAFMKRKTALRVVQTERAEAILSERLGKQATLDTDGDGVTDYDEVELFRTDPTNPDSDGDGFSDGAEILGGYNPLDARLEAIVTLESPKDFGVTRSDLLKVSSLTNVPTDLSISSSPAAMITGTAMPLAFINLFVFSTPVLVTVQADEYGNWSYQFDKELEDGDHEVYIGMTDNSGRLVAKSEPFRFVKTAQAYTPIQAQAAEQANPVATDGLLGARSMLVVASIAVVCIGLLLLLLGHFLHFSRREDLIEAH